jgi:dTDP-4-dehydrorhamnose reductase
MRILVTGAAGQLGRALPDALGGHVVTALDHAALDITSLASVQAALRAHGPDVVVNAAAYNEVDKAESEPEAAFRGNELGPRNLAVATAESGASLVHVSTDYVFDGASTTPYDERSPTNPLSSYGKSKLAGEQAVRAANPRHYVVRTAWVYAAVGRNFCNTIRKLAVNGPVRVVTDQHGSPTYAPHLAGAIATLIGTGAFGTYHLAGLGGTTWFELTRALFRQLGIATAVEAVATDAFPRPAPRPRYSVLTTIQDPRILLPRWEAGLEAYAREIAP